MQISGQPGGRHFRSPRPVGGRTNATDCQLDKLVGDHNHVTDSKFLVTAIGPLQEIQCRHAVARSFFIDADNLEYTPQLMKWVEASPMIADSGRYQLHNNLLLELFYEQDELAVDTIRVQNPVWLLIGGTGHVGMTYASELMCLNPETNLIFLSRNATKHLSALTKKFGDEARIAAYDVDIRDLDALSNIMRAICEQHRFISGIVYAAGIVTQSSLSKDSESVESVLSAKVLGVNNLLRCLELLNVEVNSLILTSSLTGD